MSVRSRGQMVQFGSFFGCDTKSSRSGGTSAGRVRKFSHDGFFQPFGDKKDTGGAELHPICWTVYNYILYNYSNHHTSGEHGIERKTPHATHHTYASRAVKEGLPPEMLQKILGHADYSTTANIYTHMLLIIFLMPVAGICFLCIVRLRLKYPEGRFLLAANSICLPIGYQTIACSQMRRFPTNRA